MKSIKLYIIEYEWHGHKMKFGPYSTKQGAMKKMKTLKSAKYVTNVKLRTIRA